MSKEKSRFVVSPEWVEERLGAHGFRTVDASWYLPAHNRNGAQEYSAAHIPGAVFFDQDTIADTGSGLPHTVPSPEFFGQEMGKLGLTESDTIVVYDGPGFFSAPRVWWLLRTMGAANVFVLDGGFDGWKAEGRPVETGAAAPEPAIFTPRPEPRAVTSFAAMTDIVASRASQIADARGAGRFTGREPEPRAGMRSGHMPGARNVPYSALSQDGRFKDIESLRQVIEGAGIDLSKPVVTSCGSGVTAAVITLALQSLGHTENSLYDGSWSEWGGRPDTAIVTGEA